MNTCVALVSAYLRFNGYVTLREQPVLIGEGRPYRYHTATDVDILAVRFPNAAVVVPRAYGKVDDDLLMAVDDLLDIHKDTVDVLIGEVKTGRPRLNEGLREEDVLYATLRRIDPGFDTPIAETIERLIRNGEAECCASGKRWRFRLVAFGEGQPALEGGPFTVVQLRHVSAFLMKAMHEHHEVWKDAQFGDSVLDLLHLFDKMGFSWQLQSRDPQPIEKANGGTGEGVNGGQQPQAAATKKAAKKVAAKKSKPAKNENKSAKPPTAKPPTEKPIKKPKMMNGDLSHGAPISMAHAYTSEED